MGKCDCSDEKKAYLSAEKKLTNALVNLSNYKLDLRNQKAATKITKKAFRWILGGSIGLPASAVAKIIAASGKGAKLGLAAAKGAVVSAFKNTSLFKGLTDASIKKVYLTMLIGSTTAYLASLLAEKYYKNKIKEWTKKKNDAKKDRDKKLKELEKCFESMKACGYCGKKMKPSCLEKCNQCGKLVCRVHLRPCSVCEKKICTACRESCDKCGRKTCSECLILCQGCGGKFCKNCFDPEIEKRELEEK